MDVLNFIEKADFPLSSTWLDKQYQITSQLADSIAKAVMQQPRFANSQAVVYSGCTVNNNIVSTGYIVFNGVLYQFKQSSVATYLVLRKQITSVQVGTETYMTYENWWLELSNSSTGSDVVGSVAWSSVLRNEPSTPWENDIIAPDSLFARINSRGYCEINGEIGLGDLLGSGEVEFPITNPLYIPNPLPIPTLIFCTLHDADNKIYPCLMQIVNNVIRVSYTGLPNDTYGVYIRSEYPLK